MQVSKSEWRREVSYTWDAILIPRVKVMDRRNFSTYCNRMLYLIIELNYISESAFAYKIRWSIEAQDVYYVSIAAGGINTWRSNCLNVDHQSWSWFII